MEWDDTCAAGRTETPATPSSRGKPLLCFVNGKSGGRRGAALMELLANRDDIDAVEIVDLTAEGPNASLRRHVGVVPDLRVLVCGGDGTVAWVLQAIEELGEVRATERSRRDALVARRMTRRDADDCFQASRASRWSKNFYDTRVRFRFENNSSATRRASSRR